MCSSDLHLLRLGVLPEERVGLLVEKSVEAVTAVYGVLAAGGAYVPLDPASPPARLAHIAADAGVRVLLAGREHRAAVTELARRGSPVTHVVWLDAGGPLPGTADSGLAELAAQPGERPAVPVRPDNLAYVLYTSGSTGSPKGVMLTHRNARWFVDWAAAEFGLRPGDRLANHAPLHFDLSVLDLFGAARAAATVVLVPSTAAAFPVELLAFLSANAVSVLYAVPSALVQLTLRAGLRPGALPDLRLVLFAGEVFPVEPLRTLMDLLPQATFYNLYGPTETNVCTYHRVQRPLDAAVPLGLPICGVELFCRREDGTPAGPGELGELLVAGPTVMRGYLGDERKTARALGPPAPDRPGVTAYRTGDLVTRDATGIWHFAGRRDSQIKSRGYRIELGEIEAALHQHPAVVECAVVPVPDPAFGNRIAAHVGARAAVRAAELIAHCRRVLPGYMVPWSVTVVDELPRTSTGKIDYPRLKASAQEGRP